MNNYGVFNSSLFVLNSSLNKAFILSPPLGEAGWGLFLFCGGRVGLLSLTKKPKIRPTLSGGISPALFSSL